MQTQPRKLIQTLFIGAYLFICMGLLYVSFLNFMHGAEKVHLDLLCRWDCGWFESIVDRGYVSTIPPLAQNLQKANVAFFPLYPTLARWVSELTSLPTRSALPLTSLIFGFGFFLLLPFLLLKPDGKMNYYKFALILTYPATFYLFVAYTESIYCLSFFLGVLSLTLRSRYAPVLALFAGLGVGLTRVSGFVIAGGVAGMSKLVWLLPSERTRSRIPWASLVWMAGSFLGAGLFFYFCYAKFGVWNLYFQTLDIGWHKEFAVGNFFYLFFRAVQKNIAPFWFARDPTRMSWVVNADTIILYVWVLYLEAKRFNRERVTLERMRAWVDAWSLKLSLLAAAFVHLLITTIGDSGPYHRWGNGIRYTMPVFFLLVILWDESWTPKWLAIRPKLKLALFSIVVLTWFPYQLYYLYLYTSSFWVS